MRRSKALCLALAICMSLLMLGGCIQLMNRDPEITFPGADEKGLIHGEAGDVIIVTAQIDDPDDFSGDSITWEMNCDQLNMTISGVGSNAVLPDQCFDVPGEYEFRVTASDELGGSDSQKVKVIVSYHKCTPTSKSPDLTIIAVNDGWGRITMAHTLITCEPNKPMTFYLVGVDPDDAGSRLASKSLQILAIDRSDSVVAYFLNNGEAPSTMPRSIKDTDIHGESHGVTHYTFTITKVDVVPQRTMIWTTSGGEIELNDPQVSWIPRDPGLYDIVCEVRDNDDCDSSGTTIVRYRINVTECPNC
jgi:hypothetical protein